MTITHKRIDITFIAGNKYRFEVTCGNVTTWSTCERDVAYDCTLAGVAVPAELQGPYDIYGNKI